MSRPSGFEEATRDGLIVLNNRLTNCAQERANQTSEAAGRGGPKLTASNYFQLITQHSRRQSRLIPALSGQQITLSPISTIAYIRVEKNGGGEEQDHQMLSCKVAANARSKHYYRGDSPCYAVRLTLLDIAM